MRPATNLSRSLTWLKRALLVALLAGSAGSTIGLWAAYVFARHEPIAYMLGVAVMSAFMASFVASAVPATFAAWFFLLHIISQLSNAARGDDGRGGP